VPTSTNRIQRAAILALAVCLAAEPAFAKIWQEGDFGQNEPRVYTYVPPGSVPPDVRCMHKGTSASTAKAKKGSHQVSHQTFSG